MAKSSKDAGFIRVARPLPAAIYHLIRRTRIPPGLPGVIPGFPGQFSLSRTLSALLRLSLAQGCYQLSIALLIHQVGFFFAVSSWDRCDGNHWPLVTS